MQFTYFQTSVTAEGNQQRVMCFQNSGMAREIFVVKRVHLSCFPFCELYTEVACVANDLIADVACVSSDVITAVACVTSDVIADVACVTSDVIADVAKDISVGTSDVERQDFQMNVAAPIFILSRDNNQELAIHLMQIITIQVKDKIQAPRLHAVNSGSDVIGTQCRVDDEMAKRSFTKHVTFRLFR
jgi:hypothetical protein